MPEHKLTSRWFRAMAALRTLDAPCPFCSYNLRGNTSTRCPECGRDFDPIELVELVRPTPTLGDRISSRWSEYALLAANIITWIVRHQRAQGPFDGGFEILAALLPLVVLAAWDAARRERTSEHSFFSTWSFLALVPEIAGLGMSRLPRALLGLPWLALLVTALHIYYTCRV